MWRHSGKNIYFKDTSIPEDMEKRINELNAHVVKLQSPSPVIDLVCYKDKNALEKKNKAFFKRQEIQKKRGQDIAYINLDNLRNSLGYDESLPFARWSVMPRFDPFSGKKVSLTRYNNNKIEED
ncbi:hypothetical protein [Levilactobacillus tongjiangensis]|uniref:Uncharacterized protein n=1 Tax=Levilactobacillus tongjiangensis TaxID=2486023 RepID=A0ABW1SSW3_9LACO|nr:hypothetical protein [Levilactobacillus tongjiangensis]